MSYSIEEETDKIINGMKEMNIDYENYNLVIVSLDLKNKLNNIISIILNKLDNSFIRRIGIPHNLEAYIIVWNNYEYVISFSNSNDYTYTWNNETEEYDLIMEKAIIELKIYNCNHEYDI